MLTFPVYEEAHRRALKRPRLEFRGAGGKRRDGKNSERGDRRRHKQSRKRTRHPARGSTWNQDERDSFERPGARSVRPPGRGGSRRTPSRADLSRRIHAPSVSLFCRKISEPHPEYSPFAAPVIPRAGIAAPGARIRREIRRLHRPLRRRKSRRRPDHFAGHCPRARRRHGNNSFRKNPERRTPNLFSSGEYRARREIQNRRPPRTSHELKTIHDQLEFQTRRRAARLPQKRHSRNRPRSRPDRQAGKITKDRQTPPRLSRRGSHRPGHSSRTHRGPPQAQALSGPRPHHHLPDRRFLRDDRRPHRAIRNPSPAHPRTSGRKLQDLSRASF